MLVTRLPVSCCSSRYHALLDLFFFQSKATKLCRKFPSCLQTICAAKTHTAACSEEGSLLATNPTFAYTLQRCLSCTGRYFLWMSPRTGSTFQQPQNWASIRLPIQHRLATYCIPWYLIQEAKTSRTATVHSCLIGACHTAAFFQLSALPASSAPHLQLNNIYLIWNHSLELSVCIHISHTCFSHSSTPRRYKVPRRPIVRSSGIMVGLLLLRSNFMAMWSYGL